MNKPGLRQVVMLMSSTTMSSVNVRVTVSPYIPGGSLTVGISVVSCQWKQVLMRINHSVHKKFDKVNVLNAMADKNSQYRILEHCQQLLYADSTIRNYSDNANGVLTCFSSIERIKLDLKLVVSA